ncbi:hypothetical protein BC567DRAFT_26632 [Phyllosticta citribraziliensis]
MVHQLLKLPKTRHSARHCITWSAIAATSCRHSILPHGSTFSQRPPWTHVSVPTGKKQQLFTEQTANERRLDCHLNQVETQQINLPRKTDAWHPTTCGRRQASKQAKKATHTHTHTHTSGSPHGPDGWLTGASSPGNGGFSWATINCKPGYLSF